MAKEITKKRVDELREGLKQKKKMLHVRTEKNRVLNKFIFPSMANLTVFLEYMATSQYINDIFEEELKALFLAKSASTIIKVDRLKRYPIFTRFTAAACRLMEDKSKAIEKEDDFRIILCDIMQESVYRGKQ